MMGRNKAVMCVALAAVMLFAVGSALAQEGPKLTIGGTTYTKWLWGNMRNNGALYGFTTVPGEGYGDNGQGTEIELLIDAKLSRAVEVKARLHSRFNQNFWTNFGGFGGRNPATENPPNGGCTGGDCGEFDPRSNQYLKLRGVSVVLTPGYHWLDSATIGSNDWGMFDPYVIGRIRYIDRDNGSGVLLQGSALGKRLSWDVARISLPRLWAGPNYTTTPSSNNGFHAADAAYGLQLRFAPSSLFDVGAIAEWVNDIEVNPQDFNFDNGLQTKQRFRNTVIGGKFGVHPSPAFDIYGAYYHSVADSDPAFGAPASFGLAGGYSPVPAGHLSDKSWNFNVDMNDPFGVGFSAKLQAFSIGADYVSMMAARRESDVLLTEGHDSTWAFPGPTNAKYGVFGGNRTAIGYGGWDGNAVQVATINVDNEFSDFDEPMAETAIGWKGVTFVPSFSKGGLDISGEYSYITYNTNWQAFGNDTVSINNSPYPQAEVDTGVGHNFRSAYAPFSDRKTHIALIKAKYVLDIGRGVDVFGKIKYIKETDNRLNDARFLPFEAGDCPANPSLPLDKAIGGCANVKNFYGPGLSTADSSYFGNPPVIVGADGTVGYQWKPWTSISDDDRNEKYWMYNIGAGYQITDDFYGSIQYNYWNVDLQDGNTAFQAYNLHEVASGTHKKNQVILKGRYILAGMEFGIEYQYNFGSFDPDFGTGFVPQAATIDDFHSVGAPVGSLGFRGRYGGWNSLEQRDFDQQRLKAFMKIQF